MSYFIKLKTHLIIGLKMWSCQYFYIFFSNHWQKRRLWMKYITFIIFNKTSSWYLLFFFLNNTFPQHSISTISSCIHFRIDDLAPNFFSTYCSLYRAVFTIRVKRRGIYKSIKTYCSLYRAVFTTVYIILSISDYHLFSHKSTYYY